MTFDPANLPFSLPAGVTEADLLDWVERRPSSSAGTERAVRADAELSHRLEKMRIDRAALGAMSELSAPPGLLDAVERTLERQMLVGLATGDPLSDLPPVSRFRVSRERPIWAFRGDAVGRRLAMAAAILLLIGGASVLGVVAMRMAGRTTPPTLITEVSPTDSGPTLPPTDGPAPITPSPDDGTRLAALDAQIETPGIDPAATADPSPPGQGMTLARAAALAGEGRLIVRVSSRDIDRTLLRYGRIASQPRTGWRLGEDAPGPLVATLQMDRPRLVDPAIEPAAPLWAGAQGLPPLFPFPAISIPRIESQRIMPTVFLARVRADEASIRAMLVGLNATTVHSAVLEESPETLPDSGPALNPDAVLWWMQDPSGWSEWASVPVVVRQAE